MKIIAFYLPQYHPIPENNKWWGPGFTEWTNVAKARPRFNGHYQPHIPADLGFYDLRLEETRIAQAQLAKEYGIGGFCYYHYWFNGRMLLEQPLNEVIRTGKPDFPLCICWANENWTRRWDGQEQEVLMEQDYENYDAKAHIEWLVKIFQDSRYVKIHGRPLFLIYRAGDIIHLAENIKVWQETARKNGFPGIYLVYIKNFNTQLTDEAFLKMGFDAILEFEPRPKSQPTTLSVPGVMIYNYQDFVKRASEKEKSIFKQFPCVFPSWDNSPRRTNGAMVIQNQDPLLYKNWLKIAMQQVEDYHEDEQIIFINAWNEWGEGCHLEPDLKNGHQFLEATRHALEEFNQGNITINFQNNLELKTSDVLPEKNDWVSFIFTISKYRPILIWGAGDGGLKTLSSLIKENIKVSGFIDGDPAKWSQQLGGLNIYSPDFAYQIFEGRKPYIIIASMYRDEIMTLIRQNGLLEMIDYLADYRLPKKSVEFDTTILSLNDKFIKCNICKGEAFYNQDGLGTENFYCARCGSSPTERMTILAFLRELGINDISELTEFKNLSILEVGGHRAFSAYLREFYGSDSVYFAPGIFSDSAINATNVPGLQYADQTFDVILAYDYLQHSLFNTFGFSEINRVLKGKGLLILQIENTIHQSEEDEERIKEMITIIEKNNFQVGLIQQDYPMYAVGFNRIITARKI